MGSTSDWETMRHAVETLERFGVPCERHVISAHRAPDRLTEYARSAKDRGLACFIAGAGAAAHLAGVTAAQTDLPVLEAVGHPTAVNPDKELTKVAVEREWPILRFERPVAMRRRLPTVPEFPSLSELDTRQRAYAGASVAVVLLAAALVVAAAASRRRRVPYAV